MLKPVEGLFIKLFIHYKAYLYRPLDYSLALNTTHTDTRTHACIYSHVHADVPVITTGLHDCGTSVCVNWQCGCRTSLCEVCQSWQCMCVCVCAYVWRSLAPRSGFMFPAWLNCYYNCSRGPCTHTTHPMTVCVFTVHAQLCMSGSNLLFWHYVHQSVSFCYSRHLFPSTFCPSSANWKHFVVPNKVLFKVG